MRAWVEYNLPLLACVDTETREVVRVVEMDEELSSPVAFYEDKGGTPSEKQIMARRTRKQLTDIADEAGWPVWESGF
jgi:hypothetical protein